MLLCRAFEILLQHDCKYQDPEPGKDSGFGGKLHRCN
jgi:hypothetical protein